MTEPTYRKVTHDEDQECEWCGTMTNVLYQIPGLAPTGESDFVCLECATDDEPEWDGDIPEDVIQDNPDDYPCLF